MRQKEGGGGVGGYLVRKLANLAIERIVLSPMVRRPFSYPWTVVREMPKRFASSFCVRPRARRAARNSEPVKSARVYHGQGIYRGQG